MGLLKGGGTTQKICPDSPTPQMQANCKHAYGTYTTLLYIIYLLDVDYMITNVSTCECTDLKHREGEKQI